MLVIMSRIRPPLPNGNYPIIWEVIKKSADKIFNGNVLDAYIAFILSYRSLKRMPIRCYPGNSDAMDFKEALLKAVNKRKHLIKQKPSGHTTNLRRRHDVVDLSHDSLQRRCRFVVMLHPYNIAGRRIYDESTTNCDVAAAPQFRR